MNTLTFADGNITLSAPKVGDSASPYSVTKSGEKDLTFKAERVGVDRKFSRKTH